MSPKGSKHIIYVRFGAVLIMALALGLATPLWAQGKNPKTPEDSAADVAPPPMPIKPGSRRDDVNPPPTDEIQPTDGRVLGEETTALPEPDDEVLTSSASQPMASGELATQIQSAMEQMEASFPAGEGDSFRGILAQHPDAEGGAFFGHTLFMRRQFDRAAWFFAADALARGDSAAALSNFSSALEETVVAGAAPQSLLQTVVMAARQANTLSPNDAIMQNNLGRSLLSLWRTDPSAADLDEAVALLEAANLVDPDNLVILANLAAALDAAGQAQRAAETLARAHELRANHPSLQIARDNASSQTSQAYQGAARNYCSVDFRCGEVCPPSIIGTINRVTCEMENSSAQMACQAGEPYPQTFDCAEEVPEFGVQLPGLSSGFTMSSPWGSVSATVDREGNVNWRIEGGPNFGAINPYLRADGRFDPDSGWSISGFRGGVKYNLVHRNPAGDLAGRWGYQPAYVQAESSSGQNPQLSGGAYGNATILH